MRTVLNMEEDMDIKKIRNSINMSQKEFSNYFGIPTGTLRNWEQGISSPPDYVFNMIYAAIRRDKMINVETMKFEKMLDELAELVGNGIEKFSEATQTSFGTKIFYDEKKEDENGYYDIVLDALIIDEVDCHHHDVISYYGQDSNEYGVKVSFDEDNENPYVFVELFESNETIIVDPKHWYFV